MPVTSFTETVEIDDFLNQFDDKTRTGIQRSLNGFGPGLAGRGEALNEAILELRPLLDDLEPVAVEPGRPRDAAGAAVHRARRRGGRDGAGGADAGGALREHGHHVRGAGRRGAVPAGVHLREPAHARRGHPRVPAPAARSCATARRSSESCARVSRTLPSLGAGAGRRVPLRHPDAAAHARPQPPPGQPVRRPGRLLRGPGGTARREPDRLDDALAAPAGGVPHAGADALQLRDAARAQRRQPVLRGRLQRHLPALHRGRGAARRRTPRAARRAGPASGDGDAENNLHINPYPNTASPGQPAECEAGNEDYVVGRPDDRQRAGQPGPGDRRAGGRRRVGAGGERP